MNSTLKGKRALVTGCRRGIGAAIVKRLAREGADVAFTYASSPEQAGATAKAAEAFGVRALAIEAGSADAWPAILGRGESRLITCNLGRLIRK